MDKIQSWLNLKGNNAATALVALGLVSEADLLAAVEADLQEIRLTDLAAYVEREAIDVKALETKLVARAAAKIEEVNP